MGILYSPVTYKIYSVRAEESQGILNSHIYQKVKLLWLFSLICKLYWLVRPEFTACVRLEDSVTPLPHSVWI